jgi:pyruvate dehydrogenase E1 component beta subunit
MNSGSPTTTSLFHKGVMGLPWMAKNPRSIDAVPEGDYVVPIGRAALAREGTDVTIVTLSLSVHHALDVAEKLAGDGIDVEVLDLRCLVPLGLSGEVVATVTDRDPTPLKAPVQRVAVPDVPIPYAHVLEYAVLPRPERIEEAVRPAVAG